jgi:hypothetical protein
MIGQAFCCRRRNHSLLGILTKIPEGFTFKRISNAFRQTGRRQGQASLSLAF